MNKRTDLELVNVEYKNDMKKVELTFMDTELGEIRTVNFNKQVYKDGSFVDDAKKAEFIEEKVMELFGVSFDRLSSCLGVKKDVYTYDKFNSLYEVETVSKFTKEDAGELINSNIKEIVDDGNAIHIKFDWNGKTYESKMGYSEYMESVKRWFVDPLKKEKQFQKFQDKFGVPFSQKDELIGKQIIVEVKTAFNKFYYAEIKKSSKR